MANFYDQLDFYRRARDKFATLRTVNYKDTIILLDLFYPTTIRRFEPSPEEISVEYHRNIRTGKVTYMNTYEENEKTAELVMLYGEYCSLKQVKGFALPFLRQSLVGHKLIVSEKIGDMTEILARKVVEQALGTYFEDASDIEAFNFYNCLVTGVTHPPREVDNEMMEVTLTLSYTNDPLYLETALPL